MRKPRKRKYVLPREKCPFCQTVVSLTATGCVPRHKDGDAWCCFHHLRLEQYCVLRREGLLWTKEERRKKMISCVAEMGAAMVVLI
jgi:hypothetical protein